MLTKVVVENFKSFKNKTVFDLDATKYHILQDTNVCDNVLKGALIVGPNATGKSNLIIAIKMLLDLLFRDNFTLQVMDSCVFSNKRNIHLEYHFVFSHKHLLYSFEIDKKGTVVVENLQVDGVSILERNNLSGRVYIDGHPTKVMDELFSEKTLLLRKCYFSDFFATTEIVKEMMIFLSNSIYVNSSTKVAISYNNLVHSILKVEDNVVNEMNSVFDNLNIGFSVLRLQFDNANGFSKQNDKPEEYVIKSNEPLIFLQRKNMQLNLPANYESLGNQTLISIFPSIMHCCKQSSLLLIDEFSSGFHNRLEELIIKYFLQNSTNSQVIFTSHSTNLLNTKLLRPDQIYTVDFEPNEGSYIARFSDENPREAQNLEKMYLSGKFGSLPIYNI